MFIFILIWERFPIWRLFFRLKPPTSSLFHSKKSPDNLEPMHVNGSTSDGWKRPRKNESTRGQMAVFLGHNVLLIFSFEHHHPVLCFFLMLLVGLEDVWCCDLQRRREKLNMTPHTKPADPIVFRTQRPANDESRRSWGLYLWNILHHTGNTRGIKDAKRLEECHAQGLTDRTFQGLLVISLDLQLGRSQALCMKPASLTPQRWWNWWILILLSGCKPWTLLVENCGSTLVCDRKS